jgi:hypothetical protein
MRALAGFGLRGPRREQHLLSREQLAAVTLPVDDGVVIGEEGRGTPAVLGLFRPQAYEVLLIGGVWTAQLIALRAAATGARVVVETGRSHSWTPVARAAGGGQPCLTVHQVGGIGPQGASVTAPVLVVRDCGSRPARSRLSPGPWQTTLTLLPFLGSESDRLLAAADVVGVQRVSPQEAELVGRALLLPGSAVEALPRLGDGVTLWSNRRTRSFVRGGPTAAEAQLLGQARRVD